ncbi:MAG TPA: maleylpyruvate isomerase N-terminal domain-containing protein [Solirubrobacteraceae bacterium]|jgi:hypothetical protein|nr:maleylpyruvate isomerase N-terminal domain-containing protein [Solirubrobacteraceae bacterium]
METDRIGRTEARRLAEEEFQRFAELTAALTPDEWAMPTDCTAWDVRKIALHVLGSAEAQASVREFAHQMRLGLPLNKQIDSHHWVCHATGRPMDLTPGHDGRLVADIVAEWAVIHGEPFDLVLDGPAGGNFRQGHDGERVEVDALDYVRTLSGRQPGRGVLSRPLPL